MPDADDLIITENGGCHCRTEQGTRYVVEANLCRRMVYEGGPYNPCIMYIM